MSDEPEFELEPCEPDEPRPLPEPADFPPSWPYPVTDEDRLNYARFLRGDICYLGWDEKNQRHDFR